MSAARQVVTCPTCSRPVPGLLALCHKPACLSAEIADDQRLAGLEDL